ncbi:RnfABCDGE type electron transport complex subunit D [Youngiibacter multivorans]|uniref:Na+-translocating ferredoxin:NAD+ oxidoreductase RnfD subunit n=1 Tax=Youngiibacter multivorans TaxID=937251 RepID=A0ABS4G737_9CLOT|nr:RnfABCDGE type electron transport complex subunit D [Youngiibacter multivorans]MBP1920346.1 Na+-translocating ferredoxin:NAD+ oxidoreductase RnfD subunit [Youngiibacter multivorans]
MENRILTVASSPHIKSSLRVSTIMRDVLIALLLPAAAGVYFNGIEGLYLIAATIASAVVSELVFSKIMRRPHTLGDLSAVVTGLVTALVLPLATPLWVAGISSLFAIIVVKCLFGGLGQNFMNPAVTGKIFVATAYGRLMTTVPFSSDDAMTRLLGQAGGNLGEASVAAIIIGGIYLIVRGVIRARIPVTIIVISLLYSAIVLGDVTVLGLNGSVYLAAFFLATDYASSATTNEGKLVFAAVVGLLGSLFIGKSGNAEGIYYAVILGNIFAPFIDTFFKGKVDTKKEANA